MDPKLKEWLDAHADEVAKYPGEWITINFGMDAVVSHSTDMAKAIDEHSKKFPNQEVVLHLVPSGDEEYFTL